MVFITRGLKTYLLQGLVHTPLVPFSVKCLEAACGVMITGECRDLIVMRLCSFLPKQATTPRSEYHSIVFYEAHLEQQDNGYKVIFNPLL